MIIENPDAFKSWLTSILEPLCDADPAALAKYVYALVKKDKPIEELREVMVDQLDVFLQQETKPFVEMLFKSLDNQMYLSAENQIEKQPTPPPESLENAKEPENENHVTTNGTRLEGRTGGTGGVIRARSPTAQTAPTAAAAAPRHRVVLSRAPPAKAALPPVARAPPQEHTLVKVLPLTELLEEPVDQLPRRRDRRTDSLRDKDDRRRRRSRSWERRGRVRRHVRDNDHNERRYEHRRAMSRSPSPRGRYRNRSPPPLAGDRQASRSRSRSPVRDRDHDRERDRLRVPRDLERDRMSRDREHRDRVSRSRDRDRSRDRSRSLSPHPDARLDHNDAYKRRCRDFDEKGYCMRGDLCQWDHGTDPVVLEDAALSRVLQPPPPVPEYNPLTPDIWCGAPAGFSPYPPPHHPPHPPRELIPIPRVRHEIPPPMGMVGAPPMSLPPRHPPPKKNFDYNRIGHRGGPGGPRPPLSMHAGNCSLEVKKVPRNLNDITHLNNHFCKFGKIVNIQVCYEGDPEAALITFSNPAEANVAYKSTEAVLNNRFIKVFWHNPENKQENTAPGGQPLNKQIDRNSQYPMTHNKVLINRDNIKATADIKQQADKEKELLNGPESKKETKPAVEPKTKQVVEMYQRARALLDTQLKQQRLLIQKLESGQVAESKKDELLEAINSSQKGIEKLSKEVFAYSEMLKQLQGNFKKPKTREEAQKELLDAELDMFKKQQEGQDVTELEKKVAKLRHQVTKQFPAHTTIRRPYSRGARFNTPTRFTRGGVTKMFSVNQSVDHRPRALLISGFESDELESLLAHFSKFGEVSNKEVDLTVPQLVLQYKVRAHAEHAAINGKHYNDRTLSITWVTNTKPVGAVANDTVPTTTHNGETTAIDNKDETPQEAPEDAILRFDEEEEDDAEEDRSWRR